MKSRKVPITAARPETSPSRSAPSTNYTRQGEQFVKQAPEPFRNPQPSARPMGGKTVQDNSVRKPVAGLAKSAPNNNIGAVGISGSAGRGSENGHVAGRSQPRKSGSPFNQGKSTRPAFYGR